MVLGIIAILVLPVRLGSSHFFVAKGSTYHTKGGRQEWPNVGSSHRRDTMNCERQKNIVRGVVYCAVGFLGNSEVVFIRVVDKYIYIYICTYM